MLREYIESKGKRNPAKPTRAYNTTVVGRGGTPKHFGGGGESIDTAMARTSNQQKTVDDLLGALRQRLFDIQAISAESPPNAKLKRTWHKGTKAKIDAIRALIQRNSGNPERFNRELEDLEHYFRVLEVKFRNLKEKN